MDFVGCIQKLTIFPGLMAVQVGACLVSQNGVILGKIIRSHLCFDLFEQHEVWLYSLFHFVT